VTPEFQTSAMTVRAPARRKPDAKLSMRCCATEYVGSGSPAIELPDAKHRWLRITTAFFASRMSLAM